MCAEADVCKMQEALARVRVRGRRAHLRSRCVDAKRGVLGSSGQQREGRLGRRAVPPRLIRSAKPDAGAAAVAAAAAFFPRSAPVSNCRKRHIFAYCLTLLANSSLYSGFAKIAPTELFRNFVT